MSDTDFRLALTAVFQGPVLIASVTYCAMTFLSYRNRGGQRALRSFLVALALLASVTAYLALTLSLAAAAAASPPPREVLTLIFACRVVVFGVLVTACRVWWRNER